MKLNAATALILHIKMIQGQVLQNLTFHISLQEIQQEILNSSGKKITSLLKVPNHSTSMQKEDQEDGVFGIEISSMALSMSEPLWNLYLDYGCIHDLIQKIFWHPMSPSQPTHLWNEFPSITLSEAMSFHYYFHLLSSLFLFAASHPLTQAV